MNVARDQQPIRIEAKSIEQAISLACVKLNVSKEDLNFKVLKEPKQGLISFFMGAKAEIEAWPKAGGSARGGSGRGERFGRKGAENEREHKKPHHHAKSRDDRNSNGGGKHKDRRDSKPGRDHHQAQAREMNTERKPPEPLTPEVQAEVEKDIRQFCKELCERIVGESVEVTSMMVEGKLRLEVDSAAVAEIIQSNTKFVESLEHVLRKKPRHLKQELPFRIFIDAQGSRKGREEELARIAREKAEEVVATGQKCILDYRSAADRKIIHMALENDQRVYTKSIGNGPGRKLMILLARGRKQGAHSEPSSDLNA